MVFLILIDGLGVRSNQTKNNRNALLEANSPQMDDLIENGSRLNCHGHFVGLPKGTSGNSEIGHLTIGAGRRVQHPYKKIERYIEKGDYEYVLDDLNMRDKKYLHLVGLCSKGGVHSDIKHMIRTVEYAKNRGIKPVIHFISDGRDVEPKSALKYTNMIPSENISTVVGRHYAMDRDNNIERTKSTVKAMCGEFDNNMESATSVIRRSYQNGLSDQYIEPTNIVDTPNITPESLVFMFNFRDDRMIQLANEIETLTNRKIYTMTRYSGVDESKNLIEYEKPEITLTEVLYNNKYPQYRVSESEKQPHVTWFFDGQRDLRYTYNDPRILQSPDVKTYDSRPSMRCKKITDELKNIDRKSDFFCLVNYPNLDLVGHTGCFSSTVTAVESINREVESIIKCIDSPVILTSDHGNAEEMGSETDAKKSHTTNRVPIDIFNKDVDLDDGELRDIAPTVLDILDEDCPNKMNGSSLILE